MPVFFQRAAIALYLLLLFACSTSEQASLLVSAAPVGSPSEQWSNNTMQDTLKRAEQPPADSEFLPSDEVLFTELREKHWLKIFPDGGRNAGGPQFFKYIYENLATSHELFQRYNQFYCGVSGSIVYPGGEERYDVVKVKDSNGQCVVGEYRRCCWPCSCDVMKHARVEQVSIQLPNDPSQRSEMYWLLTIGDPCHRCDDLPCSDLPEEVSAYQCKNGATQNGLRVWNGQLTTEHKGRLVFAILHNVRPAEQKLETVPEELLQVCQPRINATPAELKEMGGMGNIFVDLALINSDETFANDVSDLCE